MGKGSLAPYVASPLAAAHAPRCFGTRGAITLIGSKIQCHICGKAFKSLGIHVRAAHGVSRSDYCWEFGLKTIALDCPELVELKRKLHGDRMAVFGKSFRGQKLDRRPQTKAEEIAHLRQRAPSERAECPYCGLSFVRRQTRQKQATCGRKECHVKARVLARNAQRNPAKEARGNCVMCGAKTPLRYVSSPIKTCSKPCLYAYRSKLMVAARAARKDEWNPARDRWNRAP